MESLYPVLGRVTYGANHLNYYPDLRLTRPKVFHAQASLTEIMRARD
jgi:hypothetical protein